VELQAPRRCRFLHLRGADFSLGVLVDLPMGELLAGVIQFLIEVVGQAIVSIPFDCSCRIRDKPEHHALALSFLFLVGGGAVGWVSAAFIPSLVHAPELRIGGLVASPLLAGAIGYNIAKWQSKTRNPFIVPKYHFWYTVSFTFGLVCVRFAYA